MKKLSITLLLVVGLLVASSVSARDRHHNRRPYLDNPHESVRIILIERQFIDEASDNGYPEPLQCQVIVPRLESVERKIYRTREDWRSHYAGDDNDVYQESSQEAKTQRVIDKFFDVFEKSGWVRAYPSRHQEYAPDCIVDIRISDRMEPKATVSFGPDEQTVYFRQNYSADEYFQEVEKKLLIKLSNEGIVPPDQRE